MKKKLQVSATIFAVITALIVFFPFRIAQCKIPNKIDESSNIGPVFILSEPNRSDISEALGGRFTPVYSGLQSAVDYKRTFILMLPFLAGSVISFVWMRKLDQ